jgi:hypothetical protein
MPNHLNYELFATILSIIAKKGSIRLKINFAKNFLYRHSLCERNSTTTAFALTTVVARLIVTTNIFKYNTVGHLRQFKRLRIITH